MNDPTIGELNERFKAHDQRDEDRFKSSMDLMERGFKTISDQITHVRSDIADSVQDHEKRIRFIERYGTLAIGGMYVLYAMLQFGLLDSIVQKAVKAELSHYEVSIIP